MSHGGSGTCRGIPKSCQKQDAPYVSLKMETTYRFIRGFTLCKASSWSQYIYQSSNYWLIVISSLTFLFFICIKVLQHIHTGKILRGLFNVYEVLMHSSWQ